MGCNSGKPEDHERNESVDQIIRKVKKESRDEIKLLLLGTGESGKSTIAKQMRIIHGGGFTKEELQRARIILIANAIISMKCIVEAAKKMGIEVREENKERSKFFENLNIEPLDLKAGVLQELKPEYTTPEIISDINSLWKDPGIQETFEKRNNFQIMDSARYCFDNLSKFSQKDYVATESDLLYSRERTSGVVETLFKINETNFRMVDVGGQRSERNKWIHCFEDVTAIIYCVALNEYDMKLMEDQNVNRMKESLELFGELCNSKWFTKTSIILFLNKYDLFEEKIKTTDLSILFPDYKDGPDPQKAKQFIQDQFIALKRSSDKNIYPHQTTATDTDKIKLVFEVARKVIISQNFSQLGFGSV